MKFNLRKEIPSLVLFILNITASIYFYLNFPAKVPTHWNFQGQIDGWSDKTFGAFFFPVLYIFMYLLFTALPHIDPKKEQYQQFEKTYSIFKNLILAFLTIVFLLTGLAGLGYQIPIGTIVPILVGLLFIIIGNYMGKIKSNWLMGMRTPWTLSNEEVWNKTSRLSGKLMVISGIIMMLCSIIPANYIIFAFLIAVLIPTIVPTIYSYWLYNKLTQKK